MKDLRREKIGENEYLFVNEFKGTRNGFKHISTLYKNDIAIGEYSANYINRTWEYYTYQTSMQGCVNKLIQEQYDSFIEYSKELNNIKRITKDIRAKFDEEFEKNSKVIELRELYKTLEYVR